MNPFQRLFCAMLYSHRTKRSAVGKKLTHKERIIFRFVLLFIGLKLGK